jgi:hypothetical protein
MGRVPGCRPRGPVSDINVIIIIKNLIELDYVNKTKTKFSRTSIITCKI